MSTDELEQILYEICFYFSRAFSIITSTIAFLGAGIVLMKFIFGTNTAKGYAGKNNFPHKQSEDNFSSAFLSNEFGGKNADGDDSDFKSPKPKPTSQQKLSGDKMKFIKRTMFYLCLSDMLLCVFCVIFNLLEIPIMKLDFFASGSNEFVYLASIHLLRLFGQIRIFFFFFTSAWCVCYGISLLLSLNKMVWVDRGCAIKKYDVIFWICSLLCGFIPFMIWFIFRDVFFILNLLFRREEVLYDLECFLGGVVEIGTALLIVPFFLAIIGIMCANCCITTKHIRKGAKFGVKSEEIFRSEGRLFFNLTRYLAPFLIMALMNAMYCIYAGIAYFFMPFFDLTDNPSYEIINTAYNIGFPMHGILLLLVMIFNVEQIRYCMCCCDCWVIFPNWCTIIMCCGQLNGKKNDETNAKFADFSELQKMRNGKKPKSFFDLEMDTDSNINSQSKDFATTSSSEDQNQLSNSNNNIQNENAISERSVEGWGTSNIITTTPLNLNEPSSNVATEHDLISIGDDAVGVLHGSNEQIGLVGDPDS